MELLLWELHVPLPEILETKTVARSRLFSIETLKLRFSNGVERLYERLPARGRQAVIVVAINTDDEVILVREYLAGLHRYELNLPKGTVDPGETFEEAANRELKEEAGFGARKLDYVRQITLAPAYMGFSIHVILARDLYPESLPGDEPEIMEVEKWRLQEADQLVMSELLSESRSIAALKLAEVFIERENA
ncbi:MAG: ADP compounds hydrolase NudE [Pseudomonadales bacterium]|jgi:ADP-ribose diphosphatase|uniref:Nudix hydrolase domain-containing protein n=1 Tax=marine metagenome TaxID=408172 RepID=A0A381R9L0_9ZZZZ|nr:ADP compounds hydrolase NudE [Pseudomonadales bacterium]|tara:strand:- start:830 stop:1405 length:576 start_codon:yes stop_codon:yes gene_type:complete